MKQDIHGDEVIRIFEKWSPKSLAFDWDNVGLQVGSLHKPITRIMVTLDVMDNVVDEAIANGVDLIIAHHPLLFKPLKQINPDDPTGQIIQKLIKHDITVYAAHTNLDIAAGGVNDALAEKLGLFDTEVLVETEKEKLYKLAVFVPVDYADAVREAIGNNGAGYIGNYSHCTFQSPGEGTFKPQEGTNPFIGKQGELEKADEVRMETIVQGSILDHVLDAMKKAHPYEEAAYDLIPLANNGKSVGLGRVGNLAEPITLEAFCEQIKVKLDVPSLRVTGDLTDKIKRVAILGGSGEKNMSDCLRKGADVYLTGDVTFHHAQEAWQKGLRVVDPGHHVEKVMKEAVKNYLEKELKSTNVSGSIIVSQANTEPFQFM